MTRMKVGVLEILSASARPDWGQGRNFRRHYASIMPQAVSVWCRQLGHDVTYATYYGQRHPHTLLPEQLDVVFLSTFTHASPTVYALAKLFRRAGTLTVIGGAHARSFPTDCLRFFDLVVRHCDKALVADILRGAFAPGTIVSSARPPTELPSVEERLPEIARASLDGFTRPVAANVPVLSSLGCPYACDFCSDWNNPYVTVPRGAVDGGPAVRRASLPGDLGDLPRPELRRELRCDARRHRESARRGPQSVLHGELAVDPEVVAAEASEGHQLLLSRHRRGVLGKLLRESRRARASGTAKARPPGHALRGDSRNMSRTRSPTSFSGPTPMRATSRSS